MKKILTSIAALGLVAMVFMPTYAAKPSDVPKGPADKVDVCHYSEEEDKYFLINISENALDAHLAHGDHLVGTFDPSSSSATATDNKVGSVTLKINAVGYCDEPISNFDPVDDFYVMDSVIGGPFYFGTGSIPGSTADKWTKANGVYEVTLERNFFNSRPAGYEDGWYRIWDIYVLGELVEDDLELYTTYYAVGDWKLDIYIGATSYPRFVKINSHTNGDIVGFMGIGYDADGTPTGNITGTIVGQTINMHYDRVGFDDPTYTADLTGTIANDGNSISGTWSDYARTDEPWNMVRQ